MKKSIALIAILTLLVVSLKVSAGWVITQRITSDDNDIQYETLLIEDNKLKSTGSDMPFIFDLNTGDLYIMDAEKRVYWSCNISEYRETMKKTMKTITGEVLANMPEEQVKMYGAMFESMLDMWDKPSKEKIDKININIKDLGKSEEICGYATKKYDIYVNEEVMEQIWVSDDLDISDDLDTKVFANTIKEIAPISEDDENYESTDAYIDLWGKGFPLRSIDDYDGTRTEVIKIDQKDIDHSEFAPPPDYQRIEIEDMIRQEMMSGGDEDDEDSDW